MIIKPRFFNMERHWRGLDYVMRSELKSYKEHGSDDLWKDFTKEQFELDFLAGFSAIQSIDQSWNRSRLSRKPALRIANYVEVACQMEEFVKLGGWK